MQKAKLFLILLMLITVFFSGCSKSQKYYAGEKISQKSITRYSEEIAQDEIVPKIESTTSIISQATATDTETEKHPETTSALNNSLEIDTAQPPDSIVATNIYYWTPGGEKYHIYSDCSTLSRSKTIISGTLEEGMAAGKSGLCKTCEKKLNNN